ncbi:VOC family protein [Arcticibacterium luteifluviistationis]|uniref:Glyoxalase n=1 Tax=Arcticibacterium luteifluviistationis TaxID=1784714 RepID=A0A2Z4GGL9_9BACT|nr:VOC family protein [Arcticibacterium luteifluviistationis]AWW00155.1 glyoxalase [Arcticibacterium luteifluviistationis]
MKKTILCAALILSLGIIGSYGQNKSQSEKQQIDSNVTQTTNEMKSHISIFEIPATEISRAINFYQEILDLNIEKIDMPEMQMGIFPYEGQMVTGVIIQGEGYKPSADGVTIYLNGGDNLQVIIEKVEKNGGKIIVPKTLHADESGYFGIFLDSEGNKIGLHSPN